MIQAKLFLLKQEIELLWTDMQYVRELKPNGKPSSGILGGEITVCFATRSDTDLITRWLTKESLDETQRESDKMLEGEIHFYPEGFDNPVSKKYLFNDAFPVHYKEIFAAQDANPLQTILTLSPAIQNYGADLIKRWNISHVTPSEDEPFQPIEEPRVEDYFITDVNGSKIDKSKIGEKIVLNIQTKNLIGEYLTISLNDKDADFKYNGEVLPNDTLSDYKVSSNLEKIVLEVVQQQESE